ncbi:MAG: tRNA lysidine(34) synthetase TilS [Anaerolineae bacterium]
MPLQKRLLATLAQVEAALPSQLSPFQIVVGVSGGPDSLALLHLFHRTVAGDRLAAAHLNHGLRPSAGADARFVAETAAAWGVPCVIEEEDVPALALAKGLSLEEAGRQARYHFLAWVADRVGAPVVAVAHNADDQAETVLMHLLRGSGLAGLRGMLPISRLPDAPDVMLIRPFLEVSRAEIEAYCRRHELRPVEDRSNRDMAFFRNRLRHELLPLLADYSPQIGTRLRHLSALAAADYALLQDLTREKWGEVVVRSGADWVALDRKRWRAVPLSLRRALLRQAVRELRPFLRDVGFRPLEQARQVGERGQTGAQAVLPGGLRLVVQYHELLVAADPDAEPVNLPQLPGHEPLRLPVPGVVALADHWFLESAVADNVDLAAVVDNRDPWLAYVETEADALVVRSRRPGERFRPLGMRGQTAKVKDVMINRKIAARLRPLWPLVATEAHLVWLVGHHIDERVQVTGAGRRVVRLTLRRQDSDGIDQEL